jgi:RHS repeat-associated protein
VWTPGAAPRGTKIDGLDHRWEGRRVYEITGLRILEHKPDTSPRRWLYDEGGNTRRFHDHDGGVHEYRYSSWDLRDLHSDPTGATTRYTYTATTRLASVTDPGGTRSEYTFDLKDRLVEVRRNGEVRDRYGYDAAMNMVEKIDGNGDWLLRLEVGAEGVRTARHLASGGTHRFEYDELGRYAKVATDDFEVAFAYDEFGHRVADQRDGRGVEHGFAAPGSLERTTVLGRFVIGYEREEDGTLVVTDPTGAKQRIAALGHGLLRRSLSNGTRELVQFDPDGRCRMRYVERGRRSWARSFGYTGEADLHAVEDDRAGYARFEYDAAHRLVKVLREDGTEGRYRYDTAGNLLEKPGLGEMRVTSGNRLVSAGGLTLEYDRRDHVATRRGRGSVVRYSYDARDMLVRAEGPDEVWTADYDPLGRRVHKSRGDRRTEYYWDTDRLAAEMRDDGRVRIYVYPDAFAIVPFMFVDYPSSEAPPAAGTAFFVFNDHLSTPVRIENVSGEVVWSARVEPYGSAHVDVHASIDFALRLPGHYYDEETGLHYNRFRYYDPVLGRYLQSDPLGLGGGTNVYAFANGNPLKYVDPRGTCPTGPTGGDDDDDSSEDVDDGESDDARQRTGDDEGSLADLDDDDFDERITGALRVLNEEDGLSFGQEHVSREVVREKVRELENGEFVTATAVNDDDVIVDGHHGAVAKTMLDEPVDPEDGSGRMPETVVSDWRDMTIVD